MKLSKNLLTAMTFGLALGATSCKTGLLDVDLGKKSQHTDQCTDDCKMDHNQDVYDCPACGLG